MAPPWEGIKLAVRDAGKPRKTVLDVGGVRIGETFAVFASFAGDQGSAFEAANSVKKAGAAGLCWTQSAAGENGEPGDAGRFALARETAGLAGLPVISEVTDTKDVVPASAVADALMIGAANMQNFSLLKEVGRSSSKPVILVRSWHATLLEWLNSAEYVLVEGNPRVILCEAGIRSFETGSRVILDLSAVPAVKVISHLPVLVDIDRAGGAGEIERMSLAAIAAGADGLILDVSLGPGAVAAARAANGITLPEFVRLVPKLAAMSALMEGLGFDRS